MNSKIRLILSNAGLRITKPRMEIFDVIELSSEPISIADIIKKTPTLDKVSVYRTVKLFVELGLLHTVFNGWKQFYELATPFAAHHHHLICNQCGRVTEIHSEQVEKLIVELTNEYKFLPTQHHFEIKGKCSLC